MPWVSFHLRLFSFFLLNHPMGSNRLGEGVVGDVVKATSTDVLADVMEGAV